MKLTAMTKDTWVVLGVLVVMVAATFVLVYMPQGRKLDNLRNQLTAQKESLKSDAKEASVVPSIHLQVQQMRSRYRGWNRKLPKQKELGHFLREISTELTYENLSSQVIEPGKPTREELFHTLPIIMRFNGSYLSLTSFLKRIYRMERLACVQRIKVSKAPDKKDVDIELQLNIYFTES